MAVEILFVRHGQTAWNTDHRRQGHSGPGLDEVGREQVRKAAQAVAEMHATDPVAAVYSNDLARAAETAKPIAAALGLPVITDPRLRERHQGRWQGQLTEAIRVADPAGYKAVISDPLNGCPPGGETGQQVLDRLVDVLDEITARHDDERVVVVSHGGALSLLRWLALANLDPAYIQGPEWGAWIANCEVIPMIWPLEGGGKVADGKFGQILWYTRFRHSASMESSGAQDMELVFFISSLGFVLSLITHLLAAFRIVDIPPGLAFAVFYPLMELAIFANLRVILMRREDYSDEPPGEFWRHLTRNAPDWMRSLQIGLLLYGVFNFYFTMLVINRAGYPRFVDGAYILERHKVLLETLTREQYLWHASYVVRMLSAIAMAVFFAGVMRLVARWRTVVATRPAGAAEEAALS